MLPRGVALCGEQLLVAEEGGKRVQVLMRNGAPRGQLREPCFGGLLGICVDPTERRAFAAVRLGVRATPTTPLPLILILPLILSLPQVPNPNPNPNPNPSPSPSLALTLALTRRAFAIDREHNVVQHGHTRPGQCLCTAWRLEQLGPRRGRGRATGCPAAASV